MHARTDEGEEGRFRVFTREEIAERGDNLDISWLRDEDAVHHDDLPEPHEIADEIIGLLGDAMREMGVVLQRWCKGLGDVETIYLACAHS